ncbi:MAG: hypothetical protein Faunusvirus7_11 [Faunusvirus sp.]|jgi:hypothetical protein|uniref:Uncharacterized protein n=1 Tax=Faunusvirus sp. TaxID=2487766 RepID=A0A3G5A0A6_9VIRU|nr:MAG: hypothetical protein Faunusvirus7_11 [Faunusvirus sp.]
MTALQHAKHFCGLADASDDDECHKYVTLYNDFYNIATYHGDWKMSPFLYACYRRLPSTITAMIRLGDIDINISDTQQWNGLMFACVAEDTTLITALIRHGINVNAKNHLDRDALMMSCNVNNWHNAMILVNAGANYVDSIDTINEKDIYKNDPINKNKLIKYIRDDYRKIVVATMADDSKTNIFAASFKTTYVPQLANIIAEFII